MRHATVLALVLALGCRYAPREEPTGAVLYARHCAACHGADARGDGPVAPALRRAPNDLTVLARDAGGRFDTARIAAVIDGRSPVVEHGTRDMPVWGVVFEEELSDEPFTGYRAIERSRTLTAYLESIQVR
jgi:mono/diheme cytochrome c family protein